MNNSNSGNVGIVIVSHSPKIAEGAADMVRQMVGNAVPLAWTGGDLDGGLGTNVAGILEAIETAWSPAGVAILVDLGGKALRALRELDRGPRMQTDRIDENRGGRQRRENFSRAAGVDIMHKIPPRYA